MIIKVLLADDHQIVRAGLRSMLCDLASVKVEIVAEAQDVQSAVRLQRQLSPDIVIVDIDASGSPAMDAIQAMSGGKSRVIALSSRADQHSVSLVLKAGALGYLFSNGSVADELETALRMVMDRRVYLSPKVADVLVNNYVRDLGAVPGSPREKMLSPREREVLQLLAEGNTSKEIAQALCLSVKTVDTHRQQLMGKLNIRSIAQLTKYAVREGLTPLEA